MYRYRAYVRHCCILQLPGVVFMGTMVPDGDGGGGIAT